MGLVKKIENAGTMWMTEIDGDWITVDGPREVLTRDGSEIHWDLLVHNSERWAIAEQLWTGGETYDNYGLVEPASILWKGSENFTRFWVASVEMEPDGAITGGGNAGGGTTHIPEDEQGFATYDYCRMTVRFSMKHPVIIEQIEPSGKVSPIPTKDLIWDGTSEPLVAIDETPQELQAMLDWIYVLRGVRFVPEDVFELIGDVNSDTMTSNMIWKVDAQGNRSRFSAAAGEVRYDSHFLRPTYTPCVESDSALSRDPSFDLMLRFKVRPDGDWNKFRRGSDGTYDNLKVSGGSTYYPYTRSAMSGLLVTVTV